MDDIASQLNALLNSPEGMEQIKNVANMLGQSAAAPSSSSTPQNQSQQQGGLGGLAGLLSQPGLQETLSGLLGGGNQAQPGLQNALSGLLGGGGQSQPGPVQNPLGGIDPGMLNSIMKLAPLLSSAQQDDDTTRLLYALRPLLGEDRRKKLDEAVKMLKMMKMLPLLKGSGILGSLL